jgi:hypothetical protein
VFGRPCGTAETFFPAEELVLGEIADRGIGKTERVHLPEEVAEESCCANASHVSPTDG